jgi:hypothetical protein
MGSCLVDPFQAASETGQHLSLAYDVKRLLQVYIPGIEGGADDSAFGAEGFEHFKVVERGDTARGDDGFSYGVHKLGDGRKVGLGEGAVAAVIGLDEALYTQGGHGARQGCRPDFGGLAPAVGGDKAVKGVDADDDGIAVAFTCLFNEVGVFDGGGAQDYALDAGLEEPVYGFDVADAAAELRWNE